MLLSLIYGFVCVQLSSLFPSVSTRLANQLTNLFTESTSFQLTDATTKLEFSSGLTQERPSNPTKGSEETTQKLSSIQDSSTGTTDECSTVSNEPTLFSLKALSTDYSTEARLDKTDLSSNNRCGISSYSTLIDSTPSSSTEQIDITNLGHTTEQDFTSTSTDSEEMTPELSSDAALDSSTRTTDEYSTSSNEPTLFSQKALSTEYSTEATQDKTNWFSNNPGSIPSYSTPIDSTPSPSTELIDVTNLGHTTEQDFTSTSTEPLHRSSGASNRQEQTYSSEFTRQTHEHHSPSAHDFSALSTEGTRSTENYSGPFIPSSTTDQQETRELSDWLSADPMQGSTTPDPAQGHSISSLDVASSNYYTTDQQHGTTDEALQGYTSDPSPVSLMTILSSVQTDRTSEGVTGSTYTCTWYSD